MRHESGIREFPIWLLGGSEEIKLATQSESEYDPGPSPILGMWNPVISRIQNIIFKRIKKRIDELQIHIRNAIKDTDHFPNPVNKIWTPYLYNLLGEFRNLIEKHKPIILITFGAFPFEFARRALNEEETYPWDYWSSKRLGDEFRTRLENFDMKETNAIPLLHEIAQNETFEIKREQFCGSQKANYLDYVAGMVAEKILEFNKRLKIWTQ
jgi:hypothetical protein